MFNKILTLNKFDYSILLLSCCFSSCLNARYEEAKKLGGIGMPRGLIAMTNEATPGYVLFCPLLSATTYLINLEGEVVHTWESQYGPAGFVYLKDNGNLLRGGRDPQATIFGGGGQGGIIQEFSWDGELLWDYKFASPAHLSHHDISLMPNGNILVIAWELKSAEQAIKAGCKPELIPLAGLWPDMIVEFQPQGHDDANLIWEWHIWDHLVQDYNQASDNYGIVSDHAELMNINSGEPLPPPMTQEELDQRRSRNQATTNSTIENAGSDMFHTNAIDYNPELDQIVISVHDMNEIIIIDHSTTTEEAASHRGGKGGKGGDFLYRWGNAGNYDRGDTTDQILGGQHDVRWIPKGFPGEGNLTIFNNINRNSHGSYSSVLEIITPTAENGYSVGDSKPFEPDAPTWKYLAQDTMSFNAPFISGAHRMMNGNTFITDGPKGRYFEINPAGKIVWEYWTPYAGFSRMPDHTFPQPVGPMVYATFRATHISNNHPAVIHKVLKPISPQPEVYKD